MRAEFDDIATTASPFCSKNQKNKAETFKFKGWPNNSNQVRNAETDCKRDRCKLTHLHIEIRKLHDIFLQVLNERAVIAEKHHLDHPITSRSQMSNKIEWVINNNRR